MDDDELTATLHEAVLPAEWGASTTNGIAGAMRHWAARAASALASGPLGVIRDAGLDLEGAQIDVRLRGGALFRIGISRRARRAEGDGDGTGG